MVHRTDGILLEHRNSEIALFRRLFHLAADGEWKEIIARKNSDTLDLWITFRNDIGERFGQRIVRSERSEQILVALIVNLLR